MEKQWKCSVCGYLHQGRHAPDACPRCGAGMYQFILYEPLPPELEAKLRAAFAGESQAYVRNLAFARRADEEGFGQVARLFKAVAEAERVHADEYLKFLEGVAGSTEENLKRAFENEIKAKQDIYPGLVKEAFRLGREDVAWSFIRSRDVEGRHADLYKAALGALVNDRELDYHVCSACGYVFDAQPPDECPVCKSPREKFKRIA
ncbi:MAG: rubredoxin-like domain-containing protein [Thermodesulfobacteriota bacterium]